MYHPSRGGVRGGRDQFNWDDVKADKHRENYLGHSLKAPVGRWQKGKDLHWYVKDRKSEWLLSDADKAELERIKQEEEQSMREALGLAPKRDSRPRGARLDKNEVKELFQRGKGAEEPDTYAEAERIQGVGFAPVIGRTRPPVFGEHSLPMNESSNTGTQNSEVAKIPNGKVNTASADMNTEVERRKAKEERRHEKKLKMLEKSEAKGKQREEITGSSSRHDHDSKAGRSSKRRHSKSPEPTGRKAQRDGMNNKEKRKQRRHDSDSD